MAKILGILLLENRPIMHEGALCNSRTFPFLTRQIIVPGASVKTVVEDGAGIKASYIRCARQLEEEGVSAITSNCGFTALLQCDVASAVSVPVALSSLSLVPFIAKMLPAGKKLGILTYDSTKMGEQHFAAAGWSSTEIRVAVAGIEGSETWSRLAEPVPDVPSSLIIKDVTAATKALLSQNPDVAALVFECAAFTLAAETVRQLTGLVVADYVSLAKMLIEISAVETKR